VEHECARRAKLYFKTQKSKVKMAESESSQATSDSRRAGDRILTIYM
jgi:hypothetical protein